jgi:hypothetical protein
MTKFSHGNACSTLQLGVTMKTYVAIAAVLAFTTPALAGSGAYYVDLELGGKTCTSPNPKKYKALGAYGTRAEATRAMTDMVECH